MNQIEIVIDGAEFVLDVDADLTMGDISEDMDAIAGQIGWYGRCLAAARHQLDDAMDDVKYATARKLDDLYTKDPKLAVDKAKPRAEAEPEAVKARRRVNRARELVGRLQTAYEALLTKADLLRSKGALMRSEIGADGMHTSSPATDTRPPRRTDSERARGVADAMRSRGPRKRSTDDDEDADDS